MEAAWPTLLIEAALKGAVLFAIAALAMPLLRRRSAAVRYGVWCCAVCAQLLLPALALFAPQWRVPLIAHAPWAVAVLGSRDNANGAEAGDALRHIRAAAPAVRAAETAEEAERVSPPADIQARGISEHAVRILTIVWLVAASLVVLHLAIGTIGVWRLAVRGRRVLDARWLALAQELAVRVGILRPLTLLGGEALAVPVTWGIIYPVVLLPADAESWDDEQRRYVLVHEMAHIRRFDALTQVIGQLALALFWFDPLVWLAVARMRAEREHACDDYVLQAGTTPSRYANDLLTMVESIGLPNHRATRSAFAELAMARASEFEGRMLAILKDDTDRASLSHRSIVTGAAVAAAVAVALAGFTPLAAREASPQVIAASPRVATSSATTPAAARGRLAVHAQSTDTPLDSALASLPSGDTKAAVLSQYVVSGDTAHLAAALRAVRSLSSDQQKNVVLANAARRALSGGDARFHDVFFAAAASMTSDDELSAVLAHASANANGSADVTMRILRAAAGMRTPGAASTVLINVAARGLVSTDSLRALYLRSASRLDSADDRQRALIALPPVLRRQSSQP